MMRRCAVFGCENTDEETRSHPFPADIESALKWKESLRLDEFPIELLQTRFVVCGEHFKLDDYECKGEKEHNMRLKITSIPELKELNIKAQIQVDSTNGAKSPIQISEYESQSSNSPIRLPDFDEDGEQSTASDSSIQLPDYDNEVSSPEPNYGIDVVLPQMEYTEGENDDMATSAPLHANDEIDTVMNHSTASTNNTDICVLDNTHESHYGAHQSGSDDVAWPFYDDPIIDAPDFTVLRRETLTHNSNPFDESTEILMTHSECAEKRGQNIFSSTDSDVEVLTCEEVVDSDWSAGAEDLNELDAQTVDRAPEELSTEDAREPKSSSTSCSVRRQESTDQDISGQAFNSASLLAYNRLGREQLIELARQQAVRIDRLEATLQQYRNAQQTLFMHMDSLRRQFAEDAALDFNDTII